MKYVAWIAVALVLVVLALFVACSAGSYRYDISPGPVVQGYAARDARGVPPPPSGFAHPQQDPSQELLVIEKQVRPKGDQDPKGGELRARRDGRDVPLPLKHTDVRAEIAFYIGAVTVKQQYHNPYDEKIEAVYVFPLPDDAAVREFVMTIGDRQIRGIIREREEAQKIYAEAKRQGYVASLLTQERPNIFTQNVANIEPGKAIDIDITYFHALDYADGTYEFVFPMVVGPRFNPPGSTDGVGAVARGEGGSSGQKTEVEYLAPGEISSHDVSLEVDLDAGISIESLESPSHRIVVERPGPTRAKVTLEAGDRIPNKDFVLRYRLAGPGVKAALLTHRGDAGGHFALLLQPPADLDEIRGTPREMVFVIDCSGSMSGEPLEAAKRVATKCLGRLSERDTFQIFRFSNGTHAMTNRPIPATPKNVRDGVKFIDDLAAGGGTMMMDAIRATLDGRRDEDGRRRIVAILTDGFVGNDREVIGEVRRRIGDSHLFSFCVGSSPNRYLTGGLARAGRGGEVSINLSDDGAEVADRFLRRVEHPALSGIEIDWGQMRVKDVYPNPLPDLFVGAPVLVTGRFEGEGAVSVGVRGKAGGETLSTRLDVDLDAGANRHAALPSVWARSKITDLYDRLQWEDDGRELVPAIRSTALEYGLMSEFTAFVAVDSTARTAGDHGTTVPVAVPVPKGVRYETTVQDPKPAP
jgi:Ca-activated chloride channel family protein